MNLWLDKVLLPKSEGTLSYMGQKSPILRDKNMTLFKKFL